MSDGLPDCLCLYLHTITAPIADLSRKAQSTAMTRL